MTKDVNDAQTFDLWSSTGIAKRDEGASRALTKAGDEWHDHATELALKFFKAAGWEGALFEDARNYATSLGLPLPPSPNAWGAICLSLSKRNFIVKTGVYANSKNVTSHGRAQPMWRIK